MKNRKGFTLIELIVVVLIIGILAAIALPQYQKAVERARTAEALINLKALREAWERYKLIYGTTATTIEQLADLDVKIDIANSSNYFDYVISGGYPLIHANRKGGNRYHLVAVTADHKDPRYRAGIDIICAEKTTDNKGTCISFGATIKLAEFSYGYTHYLFP